jgi:hypothetical protein
MKRRVTDWECFHSVESRERAKMKEGNSALGKEFTLYSNYFSQHIYSF